MIKEIYIENSLYVKRLKRKLHLLGEVVLAGNILRLDGTESEIKKIEIEAEKIMMEKSKEEELREYLTSVSTNDPIVEGILGYLRLRPIEYYE